MKTCVALNCVDNCNWDAGPCGGVGSDYHNNCPLRKLLAACHRQRDRARKAEAELTNVWHDLRMAQRRIEQLEEQLSSLIRIRSEYDRS